MAETTLNPYVGPRPFARQDSNRFFGRDQEARELLSLIVANRAVVLYAQSGAGKTSLLSAQVTALLEAEGFEVWPFARVQGPEVSGILPSEINNIYSFYSLFSWAGNEKNTADWGNQTIPVYLQNHPHLQDETGYDQPRVLIFDQFEELFTAFPARWQEREGFLNQIARALDSDPLLRVVFSLREDYVAQLDPYAHLLPRNLGVRFRLERMLPGAALTAIRSPLRETERNFAPGVAEQLVEDLRAVRTETLSGEVKTVTGEFVEPVQLQVVCQNLWEDLPAAVTTITAEHLRQFGDVDQALSNFYTRAISRALPLAGVDEEQLRNWFETSLITPAGTRGTVYRGTRETAGISNTAVQTLEDMHIIRGEIRAGSRWVELTHDRLIEPIQQANRQWRDARQAERIKRIRQIVVALVVIVCLVGLGIPFMSLLQPNDPSDLTVRETATAFVAAVEEVATVFVGTATAQEAMAADAQSTSAALAEASTAQAPANKTATAAIATATADTIMRNTAVAQTAVAQDAINTTATAAAAETAVAQQIQEAALVIVAAEATRTFAELERVRVVRPLQPGISIGNQNSGTAGTLSTFVVDDQGVFYLLGPNFALGAADAPVLQPSPIDGGKPEDAVAFTARRIPLTDLPTINAALFINIARLEPGISFQTTVPGIGPIVGVREPEVGAMVWVYGRTSGLVERQISCVDDCTLTTSDGIVINADFIIENPLSSGDEGALVIDDEGYALGIIAANTTQGMLGATMTAVLEQFDVELVTVGLQVAQYRLGSPGVYRPTAFTSDSNILASTDFQTIHLINLQQPDAPHQLLIGHESWVSSIAFSPDGSTLASADDDGFIRLWNLQDATAEPVILRENESTIWSVAFSPDGQWLASGGLDRTVRLWNIAPAQDQSVQTQIQSPQIQGQPILVERLFHNIYVVAFSPDGKWLLIGDGDGNIRIWNMDDLQADPLILAEHEGTVFSLDFSLDGTMLISGDSEGQALLWDFSDLTKSPVELSKEGAAAAFSLDGNWLATGGLNGAVYLWPANNVSAEPQRLTGHNGLVSSLAFSPNGVLLASSSTDGTVRLWLVR